jgi:hypothetical protein
VSTSEPTDGAWSDAHESEFSALVVAGASYSWLFSRFGQVARVVWLPILAATAVLALMVKAYFTMLARYLSEPSAQAASLTVGLAIGLAFVWLLFNIQASARLACLLYDEKSKQPPISPRRAVGARLYAAILRLLLVVIVALTVDITVVTLAVEILPFRFASTLHWAEWVGAVLVVAMFSARCAVLQPALALYQGRAALRRSWQMTKRRQGQFLLLGAALWVLPTMVLQSLGEFAMQPILTRIAANHSSIASAALGLASSNLAILGIVGTVALSSTMALVLSTIGSCFAYDALIRPRSA